MSYAHQEESFSSTINPLVNLGRSAQAASRILSTASTGQKDKALMMIANALIEQTKIILDSNRVDIARAEEQGMDLSLQDRLRLTPERIEAMAHSVRGVMGLPDPVGRVRERVMRPNGLRIEKVGVPIGVIGMIFEARPNVVVDAAALCLKSGNACLLRGGADSWNTATTLHTIIHQAVSRAGLPPESVQTLPSADRALVGALLSLDAYVDVIIPRGGKSLIERVRRESRIPVFSHLDGICHTYIDRAADITMATDVCVNAKMRRPSICGATECIVFDRSCLSTHAAPVLTALLDKGCSVRVPQELFELDERLVLAVDGDYGHEFLAPVVAVAVVEGVYDAVDFINRHGSRHTEAILTEDKDAAAYFMEHVGSAIVMHNASTQFADGGEFGKGAEMGIATGKLHARGPVGLEELTTYAYRVYGQGHVRG